MKFDINNRFTGKVQFTAEIECDEDASRSMKVGLAVKWAINTRADLSGAYLSDANLSGAYLSDANLSRAYLSDADLSRAYLSDADLSGADLSRAYLSGADLSGAYLSGAYLSGANLSGANLSGANLSGANLSRAYLSRANLSRADLSDAYLSGAYLSGADLSGAYLLDADLSRAYLSGADLSGAKKIDQSEIPVIANIDAAILAAIEAGGKLDMGAWHGPDGHWCGTTHCRAGWAIHLAGEKGKALQDKVGPNVAGALIYAASRPGKPPPWFFASTDAAMADIVKCAKEST